MLPLCLIGETDKICPTLDDDGLPHIGQKINKGEPYACIVDEVRCKSKKELSKTNEVRCNSHKTNERCKLHQQMS